MYFGESPFETYDIQVGRWVSKGPNTFGMIMGYYSDEYENWLSQVEDRAIEPIIKLSNLCEITNEERRAVAEYIAVTGIRNSVSLDETTQELLGDEEAWNNTKERLLDSLPLEAKTQLTDIVNARIQGYISDEELNAQFPALSSLIMKDSPMDSEWMQENLKDIRGIALHDQGFCDWLVQEFCEMTWHVTHVAQKGDFFLLSDYPSVNAS